MTQTLHHIRKDRVAIADQATNQAASANWRGD